MAHIGRRDLLLALGASVATGTVAAGLGCATAAARGSPAAPAEPVTGMRVLPWAYARLDPDATAERAFAAYQRGHCAYGAAAAFQVLSSKPEPLVDALYSWYESRPLPDYVPAAAKYPNVPTVAHSPLCHASISRWCEASKKRSYSPERMERCGVLAASTAREAVVLLNQQLAGKLLPVKLDPATTTCMSCHEKGGLLENTRTKAECNSCHHLGPQHGI